MALGRYVYCVAATGERASLGEIGIEGKKVYTLSFGDLSAVVHNCPAEPYRSEDREVVQSWVMAHHVVVEAAWERWGTVLPSSFDTIIQGETESSADQNVQTWIQQEFERLQARIARVKGRAEYGVQVFWDPNLVAEELSRATPEISALAEELRTKSRGLAYLYRQKLDALVRREMEARADQCFKDVYRRLRRFTDDVRVEKTRNSKQGLEMIINLSCLVRQGEHTRLGAELDEIHQMKGFRVHFTGPWPPYSFVDGG